MKIQNNKFLDRIVQVLLPVFTVLAFAFTAFKRPDIGLVFNLIAQVFWVYAGYQAWKRANQFGIFITAVIITFFVIYGVINYWFL